MSALTDKKPAATYTWLLHLSGPGPLTETPRPVCLGDGTETPLALATTGLYWDGELVGSGGGGGVALTSYATQVATLGDYPAAFPPVIGSGSADAVAGNDARLSDPRNPATGSTWTNGTISGTVTVNSTTWTFGTGAAAALVGKLVETVDIATTGTFEINSSNASTYNGKLIRFTGASALALTFNGANPSALPVGFNCAWKQKGDGQVTFAGSGGITLESYASLVKSAGKNAMGSIILSASMELSLGGQLA